MTLHPIFAEILEKQLGVKMCDDDRHDDVDYDYQNQYGDFMEGWNEEEDGIDFEEEQKAELRGNRL